MNALTQVFSRFLGSMPGMSVLDGGRKREFDTVTEWPTAGRCGAANWRLYSPFAANDGATDDESLRWQASGVTREIALEIVPREQYDAWVARSAAPADAQPNLADSTLGRALSTFAAETMGCELPRMQPWHPASSINVVVDPGARAREEFALDWVVLGGPDASAAEALLTPEFQAYWLQTSHSLADESGVPAIDLRLRVHEGTAQIHTVHARHDSPLDAVQSLVELGQLLLGTLAAFSSTATPAERTAA